MADNLPIYGEGPMLRSGVQFADLLLFRHVDTSPIWEKSDRFIAQMEGASAVSEARAELKEPTKTGLLRAHSIMFSGRRGAGELRTSAVGGPYRGQDCPEPEFIDRSLDNFFSWMTAASLSDIHPIEKAALVLTRIVDIWPFEIGNLTSAVVLGNAFLNQAGLPPFFVLPQQRAEFDKIIAQAITIETQKLVSAIHQTLKRELQALKEGN
jgi:Fic family protein